MNGPDRARLLQTVATGTTVEGRPLVQEVPTAIIRAQVVPATIATEDDATTAPPGSSRGSIDVILSPRDINGARITPSAGDRIAIEQRDGLIGTFEIDGEPAAIRRGGHTTGWHLRARRVNRPTLTPGP